MIAANSTKRKRRETPPHNQGLPAGMHLNRAQLKADPAWGWALTEVEHVQDITNTHRKQTCRLLLPSPSTLCPTKSFLLQLTKPAALTADEEDVIIISDDDEPASACTKKNCAKANPYCLNYLGQEKWQHESDSMKSFLAKLKLGSNLQDSKRIQGTPVGLVNLGATCYANSSLQVWFRDASFRNGVYQCASDSPESPIFQLQVVFAGLEVGPSNSFNPIKLDTQQDAQEFSKLFITLLDKEFQKQSIDRVKTLVKDRFQGTQVYGTRCNSCATPSERGTEFFEIEVNFMNNAKLEDCIDKSLEPEILSGDNQYFCSVCQTKRDATRYSKYRSLPPALHFSLQRFVYDYDTMSRKKLKDIINFPKTLDMGKFIADSAPNQNVYELKAVLLHKGSSAYQGHYQAQVFDEAKSSWFLFNDEVVSPINDLVGKRKPPKSKHLAANQKQRAKKKRRVEDSDEEVEDLTPEPAIEQYVSSKEAYMLVYARHEPQSQDLMPVDIPQAALAIIEQDADEFQRREKHHELKLSEAKTAFLKTRMHVLEIVREWVADAEDGVVVSRQGLERWIKEEALSVTLRGLKEGVTRESSPGKGKEKEAPEPTVINIEEDILCREHRLLNPHLANDMKVINKRAFQKILQFTECTFTPELTIDDVCPACVEASFKERRYEHDHPIVVEEFYENGLSTDEAEDGFWISKPWLRDWQAKKPKMHIFGEDDPSPNSEAYRNHVYCQHDMLTPNALHRRKVTAEGFDILEQVFPSLVTLDSSQEPCPICAVEQHLSKEQRLDLRKKAEVEKNRFQFMLEKSAETLEDVPLALVPASFMAKWKKWAQGRGEAPQPEPFSNEHFLCEHNQLIIDPNESSDMSGTAWVIRREDFIALATEYYLGSGPLIPLTRLVLDGGIMHYLHDLDVCSQCRLARKTTWEVNEITIRTEGSAAPSANGASFRPVTGKRQSQRLQRMKECKMSATKETTVKDIKMMVQSELKIPTIRQTIFLRGRELDDSSECIGPELYLNEVLELREEREVLELSDDEEPSSPSKRVEGAAFGGTLLAPSL
ncbi:cysteine proteinase [Flagelloscypha sp. PMI_526]|nr:cysteine proteinase [Flagelloscypha sp. PMI_526]